MNIQSTGDSPHQIVPAAVTIQVDDLSTQKQAGETSCHKILIQFLSRNTADRDLCIPEAVQGKV